MSDGVPQPIPPAVLSTAPDPGTEAHRLIRGALVRVIGYMAMVVLSVVSTAVVTRALGVRGFGQYATVISVTFLVATITDSGMTNVASREYALLDGAEREQTLNAVLGLRITLTLIGTALSIGFAYAAHYDAPLILGMVVASAATVPLIIQHTLLIPLTNQLHLGALSMLELGRQALWTAALIVLALVGAGVLPLLSAGLLANLIIIAVTIPVVRGLTRISLRMRFSGWRRLMGPTLVFSIASAVGTLYLYGTQLITSLVTNHYQTGLFSLVFRVFLTTTNIPALVGGAAIPLLTRAGRDDASRLSYVLRRYLELSIVAGIGVALVLSAASGFIIPLVAGPRFHAAIPVAEIQSFALIGTFVSSPCSFGLLSLHLYHRLLAANAVALVVMVIITDVLASADGATGAAVASICGETTVAVFMLAGLMRALPAARPSWPLIGKLALACACAAPIAVGPWLPSLPRAVVTGILFLAIVLITRALPEEVLQTLPLMHRATPSR